VSLVPAGLACAHRIYVPCGAFVWHGLFPVSFRACEGLSQTFTEAPLALGRMHNLGRCVRLNVEYLGVGNHSICRSMTTVRVVETLTGDLTEDIRLYEVLSTALACRTTIGIPIVPALNAL